MSVEKVSIRKWLFQNKDKFSDRQLLIDTCAKVLKVSPASVKTKINLFLPKETGQKVGLSKNDLLKAHDPLTKIREACKELAIDELFPQAEFREIRCKLDTTKFNRFATNQEFEQYKTIAPNHEIFWGNPADIKSLKSTGRFK